MGIKSPKELWNFSKELAEFKRKAPEIKSLFEQFDKYENPELSLEKILDAVKKNPITDDLLKVSRTYKMILRAEKNAKERGWDYAGMECVKEMGVNVKIIGEENIPKGPALYLSNHPYGLLDSVILIGNFYSLLKEKGEKIKMIGMNQLRFIKGLEEIVNFVHSTIQSSNIKSLKNSLSYMNNGGNLVVYPSGTMSGSKLKEYPWDNGITPFISHSLHVVPMWLSGPDHEKIYNFLARHKKTEKFRRIFSLREAWNKEGKTIILKIGEPISSEKLVEIKDNEEKILYLRKHAENLKIDLLRQK